MAVDGCSVKASNYRYPTSVLAVIFLVVEVLLLEKVTRALSEAKHSDACAPSRPCILLMFLPGVLLRCFSQAKYISSVRRPLRSGV